MSSIPSGSSQSLRNLLAVLDSALQSLRDASRPSFHPLRVTPPPASIQFPRLNPLYRLNSVVPPPSILPPRLNGFDPFRHIPRASFNLEPQFIHLSSSAERSDELFRSIIGSQLQPQNNPAPLFGMGLFGQNDPIARILQASFENPDQRYDNAIRQNRSGGEYLAELLEKRMKSLGKKEQEELAEQIASFDSELIVNWPRWMIEETIFADAPPTAENTDKLLASYLPTLTELRNKALKKNLLEKTAETEDRIKILTKEIDEGIGIIATELIKDQNFIAAMKIATDIYKQKNVKAEEPEKS